MGRQLRLLARIVAILGPAFVVRTGLNGQESIHYSRKDLHALMHSAVTPADYRLLASYFRVQERSYHLKAISDEKGYQQVMAAMASPKFPTPAQAAKWSLEYDEYKTKQMARLAEQYERLAANPASTGAAADSKSAPLVSSATAFTPNERILLQRIERLEQQLQASRNARSAPTDYPK